MFNKTEDDLTDENKSYEHAITTASAVAIWQLDCQHANDSGCVVTECWSLSYIDTY